MEERESLEEESESLEVLPDKEEGEGEGVHADNLKTMKNRQHSGTYI